MINEDLYRRGYSTPLLKCITNKRAEYILAEIHEGICGNHAGVRTMAAKVLRADYYWPTIQGDCAEYMKKCAKFQEFGPLHHTRPEELHSIISPWSFAIWGMDIIGPFSPGKGQTKFLLVGVDYFTKWIEVEPLASISAKNMQNFVWKSIVCRFGVPHTIITNNGRQFIDWGLQSFYDDLGIKSITASVEHPQTNGQAEAANKVILNKLKKRLGKGQRLMDRGADRGTLGVQVHPPDYHAGDTLQPDIRDRGHDPGWDGRAHHTTTDVRPHPKREKPSGQPWLGKWVSWQKQDPGGHLQNPGVQTVQHKGPAEEFPKGRPRLKNARRCEKKWREILVQLGGAFPSPRSRTGGSLSFRMAFRQNCTEDVECHAPQVLLQLKSIKSRTLSSPNQGGFNKVFSSKYWRNFPATTQLGLDEALTDIPCRDRPPSLVWTKP